MVDVPAAVLPDLSVAAVQRRTVRVLVASQVLGGVGVASGIAVSGLLADEVSGSTTLSGLSSTATVFGAALAALPLARLMSARGRRPGLATGWLVGALGAGVAVLAAVLGWFPLLLLGSGLFGAASAANLQARYAATDCAEPHRRGRALAVVVWATTLGAVLGPNLTGRGAVTARALGLPELAGPYVFSVLSFAAGALVVLALLHPDPLLTARAIRDPDRVRPPHPQLATSLAVVRRSPQAVLGLTTVVLAQAVMVSVMTMTPVHMLHGGAELRVVGFVISVHIAGMYAFSPLVGLLADRCGRVPVVVAGQAVFGASFLVSGLLGPSSLALGVGLGLLGLGWSCGLVAGSTLLSESVPADDRPGVQGASDFLMNLGGGFGGAASGGVLAWLGYGGLNAAAAVLVLPVVVLAVLFRGPHADAQDARR